LGRSRESGDVECQSQLVRWSDNIEQSLKRRAQVGDRRFLRRPVADSSDAWPKLGRGAPDAVLVLLDDVGHVNDTGHEEKDNGLTPVQDERQPLIGKITTCRDV
jgi:hypothetical protein